MNIITSDPYVSQMLTEQRIASGTGQRYTISRGRSYRPSQPVSSQPTLLPALP
jgi:hypothetical protein